MYKDRAAKSEPVTESKWLLVNKEYRDLVNEFLREVRTSQTKKQYKSALRQFGWYLYNHLDNKKYYDITKREANAYVNYLLDLNMSSSAIGLKKSVLSSLNNYVETFVVDDDKRYSNFSNFMRGLKPVDKTVTIDKSNTVTDDEYNKAVVTLRESGNLLEAAWLTIAFYTGCRKSEISQLKTEVLDYDKLSGQKYITSHPIRGKGRGKMGKILRVIIPIPALDDVVKYVESRSFDSEYIFSYVNKRKEVSVIYESWANDFCDITLTPILGRKITPHILRHSCITNLLDKGVDIGSVSKYIAHHENVSTTQLYDHRDDTAEKNDMFNYK